ncbi:hypothetical protein LP420_25070 [Massilia sp. B-10]|nr:hypothetical protein LP420_25070 [Massilia sp. B-10]
MKNPNRGQTSILKLFRNRGQTSILEYLLAFLFAPPTGACLFGIASEGGGHAVRERNRAKEHRAVGRRAQLRKRGVGNCLIEQRDIAPGAPSPHHPGTSSCDEE